MVKQSRSFRMSLIFAVAAVVYCGGVYRGGFVATAQAGAFEWGDLAGNDVAFFEVTEFSDEATSLYAPMPGDGRPYDSREFTFLNSTGLRFAVGKQFSRHDRQHAHDDHHCLSYSIA